jgi:hypothetical protein
LLLSDFGRVVIEAFRCHCCAGSAWLIARAGNEQAVSVAIVDMEYLCALSVSTTPLIRRGRGKEREQAEDHTIKKPIFKIHEFLCE